MSMVVRRQARCKGWQADPLNELYLPCPIQRVFAAGVLMGSS